MDGHLLPLRPTAPAVPRFPAPLLVDGHVHIDAPPEVGAVLSRAMENLRRAARAAGLAPGTGVLLLTEKAEIQVFRHLSGGSPPGWRISCPMPV